MSPSDIFQSLRAGLQTKTGGSITSCLREMAALRSIVFRQFPTSVDQVVGLELAVGAAPVLEELPPEAPAPLPVRVYRQRKSPASGPADRYAPFKLLWLKVIIRAAYDYALWKDSKDLRHRKFAEDAGKWLFDPSGHENSLEHVCELWGLPLRRMREFARNLTKDDVKKLEFKERQGRDLTTAALAEKVVAIDGYAR